MLRSAHFVARPSIVSQLNVNDGWPPAAIQWRFGKSKRVKEDEEEEEEEEKKDDESEGVQERWSTNSVSDRELTGEHTSSLIITIMIIMIIMIMIIVMLMRRR